MSIPDRTGFTLVEAVVALLIVTGVLAGAFAAAAADVAARHRGERVRQAAVLLEELHARAELLTTEELGRLAVARTGRFSPRMSRYSWEMKAHAVPGEPELFELEMAVSWNTGTLASATRLAPRPR